MNAETKLQLSTKGFIPEGFTGDTKKFGTIDWPILEKAMAERTPMEGEVTGIMANNLLVKFTNSKLEGVIGIIPHSEIQGYKLIEEEHIPSLVGRKILFQVNNVDRDRAVCVLSRREVHENMRKQVFEEIKPGDIVPAVVVSYARNEETKKYFGVYLDLGGVIGIIYNEELSYQWFDNPGRIVKKLDQIEVKVLSVDFEKQRVVCSLKQMMVNPLEKYKKLLETAKANKTLFELAGRVTTILPDYRRIFVEVVPGVSISCPPPKRIPPKDSKVLCIINSVDDQKNRMTGYIIKYLGR